MCGPEEVKMSTTVYRDPDVVVGDNSDALRAVNGLLVNEQSAENKEAALQAISDLHDACESDFQDLCLAQPVSMSMMQVQSLNDAMDNVFDGIISQMLSGSPSSSTSAFGSSFSTEGSSEEDGVSTQTIFVEFGRRLLEKEKESEGLRVLHSLAVKLFTPLVKLHDKVVPVHRRLVSPVARPHLTAAASKSKAAKTETSRKLQRGPPPPPEEEESESEGEEEDGPPRGPPSKMKPKPKPAPKVKPDSLYSGALGYGSADGCLYKNFQQLQPPCQEAIANVYQLRQDYWAETQAAASCDHPPFHHHHGFPILLLLAPLLIFVAFKRRARLLSVRKTLEVIHANPALKAQVEALSGVPVPVAKCCDGKSKCVAVLKAVGTVLVVALCSFIIAATSLIVACGIVGSMSYTADGVEVHPSGFVALLVLFAVTALEVVLFVGIVRGCKLMCAPSPFPATASAEPVPTEVGAAAATLTVPLVPRDNNDDYGSGAPRYRSFFARVAGVTRRLSLPFGYTQLPSNDSEMVPIGSSVELGTALPVYTQLPAGPTTVYATATAPYEYQQEPHHAGGSPYVKPISIL